MSKNEKLEMKSWKKEQTKVNKTRTNENKFPADEGRKEPDDISEAFPNFSVLTEEERLAFFQALIAARKNVEKRGVPTRKSFGTVHDEYLKYFHQNDQLDEEIQQEDRTVKSGFTFRKNGGQTRTGKFGSRVYQKPQEEEKRSLSILPLRNVAESSREIFTPTALQSKSWEQQESLIRIETDKLINIFLKKKKKNEEKANRGKSYEITLKNDEDLENRWAAQSFSRESDTPKFDALSPEEKEVFFRILQEAHDNVLDKNPNKKCPILPLETILRRYQGSNAITTVFSTTQDIHKCGEPKRDLKVTVTLTSKDNERLQMNQAQMQTNAFVTEAFRKFNAENLYPIELSTDESEEEDEECSKSDIVISKAENTSQEEDSCTDCKSPLSQTPSPKEPSKDSFRSSKASSPDKQIKLYENKTTTNEQYQLKKGEKLKKSEFQQNAPVVTRVYSAEGNLTAGKRENVPLPENNSEASKEAEKLDCWPLTSRKRKKPEDGVKTQSNAFSEKSKKARKKHCPEENVQSKTEECETMLTRGELEKKDKNSDVKQETGLQKKVSFFCEGSSDSVKKNCESARERKEEPEKKEGRKKRNSEKKNSPRTEVRETSLNRVMLVNGDVVGKIERLIRYLEVKANKNVHLEKEYLKLLVDYADYLSKVLESLIIRKEKQQQQQQKRNAREASKFRRCCDDSEKTNAANPKSSKSEFVSCSVSEPDIKWKLQSMNPVEEKTPKEPNEEIDANLTVMSDSESGESEGESRFKLRKDDRNRILSTKIRLLQDLLRQRAEFVEGNFDNFKIVQFPEEAFVPVDKPPTVKLLKENETKEEKEKKKKFFKILTKCFTCGKKTKKTPEEDIVENLKGEAVRVDVSGSKKKDASSSILNQATLEVLKAAERKKIIDKYFMDS